MNDESCFYYASLEKCLIGRVQVRIASLTFSDISRKEIPSILRWRKRIYQSTTYSSSRHNPRNRIPAHIAPCELEDVLRTSQLTRSDLQSSLLPGAPPPKLKTLDVKITCFEGRHKLRAAEYFHDATDCWWTIELYCFKPDDPLRSQFIQKLSEHHYYSTPPSDGEVYLKVRHYQLLCQEDIAREWILQLSENKQKNLSQLLDHPSWVEALDELSNFSGLWNGFELGNIHKHLALHFDEAQLYYLHHIYTTWNAITICDETVRRAVDTQTVENLEMLSPSFRLDREYIIREMDCSANESALFPTVEDRPKRNQIKEAMLALKVMIPTIKSFHENRKHLCIGVGVIKNLLLEKVSGSIYQALSSCWSLPKAVLQEFEDGNYKCVILAQANVQNFCFIQLFLAALRQFPQLSTETPRKEKFSRKRKRNARASPEITQGFINPVNQFQFLERARVLGFASKKIIQGLRNDRDLRIPIPQTFAEDEYGEIKGRRWGRPYNETYQLIRTRLFLTHLSKAHTHGGLNPSVLFVQRDFIRSFFGWMFNSNWNLENTLPTLDELAMSPISSELAMSPTPQGSASQSSVEEAASATTSVSSRYTEVIPPHLETNLTPQSLSQRWSQFSLPTMTESEAEYRDRTPLQDPGSTLLEDRCSFPTPNQRGGIQTSYIHAIHQSPSFRQLDVERRSFPATELQEQASHVLPSSLNGHENVPSSRLEYRNLDRRSFPTLEIRDVSESRDSFNVNPQTSYEDSLDRRSFPALQLPSLELQTGTEYQRSEDPLFRFTEHNGMRTSRKLTNDMQSYLQRRQGWVMMVLERQILKTINFAHIVKHMIISNRRLVQYFHVAPLHAEKFRLKQAARP